MLASLSLVADLGFALPPEEAMRACLIATAVARRMGLPERDVSDVFYVALLEHVGCTGFAHESAAVYGDELVLNAAAARTNDADLRDVAANFLSPITRGRPPVERARLLLFTLVRGNAAGRQYATAACEVGSTAARRLGLPESVQRGLYEVYEGWNGKGGAHGLKGDAIALPSRIVQLGATAALFDSIGGPELSVQAVRDRAGHALDPEIVAIFTAGAREIIAEAGADDPHAAVLAVEPEPARSVPLGRLADVAAVFGDVVDLKSPYFHGHSSGVAELAREAATGLGMDPAERDRVHVAALLHDLGRVGISTGVWERQAPLTAAQWEQVRLHPYHSERILARSTALRPMAEIVGMHHERLDGSGYHRGARAREIAMSARVLAAADAYQAMTQARPHRPAVTPDAAAERLHDDVRLGRLDDAATSAVLDAAGLARPRTRAALPAGLSEREVEVLRVLARGCTNREIADLLSISPRTAEHHVEHIYSKIGASSRAAAALFAMEHDLLD